MNKKEFEKMISTYIDEMHEIIISNKLSKQDKYKEIGNLTIALSKKMKTNKDRLEHYITSPIHSLILENALRANVAKQTVYIMDYLSRQEFYDFLNEFAESSIEQLKWLICEVKHKDN